MKRNLTYNQIINLAYFSFIICVDGISEKDPSYILEKWKMYIGIEPTYINGWGDDSYFTASQENGDYCRKWGIEHENEINNILLYLFSVKYILSKNIFDIEKLYKLYIGDININDSELIYLGVHPNLNKLIITWLASDENKDILTILKRDQIINTLIKKDD